jgi:hypothetical protein
MGRAGIEPATLGLRGSWLPGLLTCKYTHSWRTQASVTAPAQQVCARRVEIGARCAAPGRVHRASRQHGENAIGAPNTRAKLCGGTERAFPTMDHGKFHQGALSSFSIEHRRGGRRTGRPRADAAPLHLARQAPLSPPAGRALPHITPSSRGILARERRRSCRRAPEGSSSSAPHAGGAAQASASPATEGRVDRLRPVSNPPGGSARSLPIGTGLGRRHTPEGSST